MSRITETDLVPSRRKLLEDIEINFSKLKGAGILTLADLRNNLKKAKNIASFSDEINIEIDYLTLLRREIESYFPKTHSLSFFIVVEKRSNDKT